MFPRIAISSWCLIWAISSVPLLAAEDSKPNVILIMADDLGFETIAANGGTSYKTPNLDSLAVGGARFTQCYVQPLCTPTRVQLMTGIYNVRNYIRFGAMDPGAVTFGNRFRDAGYKTCIVGKWQLGQALELPNKFGFDEHCLWQHTRRPPRYANPGLEINGKERDYSAGEYGPDIVNDYAIEFVARNAKTPFFLYYPMMLTHGPYQPTPDSKDWDPKAIGEAVNRSPEHFVDMVQYMDKLVGRLVAKLDALGIREKTLIVFIGDNGTGAGTVSMMGDRRVVGGKGTTTAAGMHVPLIANWPGKVKAGMVSDQLVDSTDIHPTICEAADIPIKTGPALDGRSFFSTLTGSPMNPRTWIYSWYSPRQSEDRKVREFAFNQNFKLYRTGEFFDLRKDVQEKAPLAVASLTGESAAVARSLQSALDQFRSARPSELLLPRYATAELRVGATVVDVTPQQFPVLVNGNMISKSVDTIKSPINARALVLDDGKERLAIVVVDSCMMPRQLLDEAKELAAKQTKIRPDRMLISATHTHSAPSSLACLGTDADAEYVPYLRVKLAQAIAEAETKLEPAQVGWAVGNAAKYTALRRWIRRPDRIAEDPFGNPTVRANMHAAQKLEDVIGESGPEDPDLSLISFQTEDGRPLAVLANFSMHYFGDQALSADYFGLFCEGMKKTLTRDSQPNRAPFVGLLSHGCSGDIFRRDYRDPKAADITIEQYTDELLNIALSALDKADYRGDADLAMSETRMELKYRVPDKQRIEWANRIVTSMGDRLPKDTTEVYAREQLILDERKSTQIVVQALRIGDIAIATTPNETYALTGLKLKLQSPLSKTMVIELANGGDGYIPPPEQHYLGGYNTWAARSAGLEVTAEPKIAEAALEQLEIVAGKPRRPLAATRGPACETVLKTNPIAYWRLDEMAGSRAADASGNRRDSFYEPGIVFFLDGPRSDAYCAAGETNRAAHFAGGRLQARLPELKNQYSVSMWFWNGMPLDGSPVAGWILSRGNNHGLGQGSVHVGLGGTSNSGKLIVHTADGHSRAQTIAGKIEIARWSWNHLVFVQSGAELRVHLNGHPEPDIAARADHSGNFPSHRFDQLFVGGRSDNQANWEGRIDEVAVFDRALTIDEIRDLYPR